MPYKPVDLEEWAHGLRIASDAALAEFGNEVLELVENSWMVDAYLDGLRELERLTEQKFPNAHGGEIWCKHLGWVEDRLAAFEEQATERLDKRRERAEKINVAEMFVPPLEYDL